MQFFWIYTLRVELLDHTAIKLLRNKPWYKNKFILWWIAWVHCSLPLRGLLYTWMHCHVTGSGYPVGDVYTSLSWHWTWPYDLLWPVEYNACFILGGTAWFGFYLFPLRIYIPERGHSFSFGPKKTSDTEPKPSQHETWARKRPFVVGNRWDLGALCYETER